MTYYIQMIHGLSDQRRRAERRRDGYVIAFLLMIPWSGLLFAWLSMNPQQPLWKTFAVSAITGSITLYYLWKARFYDAVAQHTRDTIAVVVAARNSERKT